MICLHFLHCWKMATCIFLFVSFYVDQFFILYAKFISTGTAVRFENWKYTFFVYCSLCFIYDVNISGLLIMSRHPMLYSFSVIIVKVLLQSDENKCAYDISYNSQVFAYEMICDSVLVDLIIIRNSAEFVQKHGTTFSELYH